MEAAVSSSMGAMGPVLKKLDLLLAPESRLRKRVKDGIGLLKEDLEEVSSGLVDLSMAETPGPRAKCWMGEARELSYQIEDFIDYIMPICRDGADAKTRSICSYRVTRVKIARLPVPPKRSTRMAKIAELRALLWQASERLERYEVNASSCSSHVMITRRRAPASHGGAAKLVGMEDSKAKLTEMLTVEAECQLKVVSIVGLAGVGKTTLAKEIFRQLGGQFELRAFARASRNLDMRRFLGSILSQVGQDHELPSVAGTVQRLIDSIKEQLQYKRYFIVIDDLWEETSWDIIRGAFPNVNNCSRIVATTEIMKVSLKCCSYMSDNVFKMEPLGIKNSRNLFLSRVFGSEQQCPDALIEVSIDIIKKCGGLPLVLISLAGPLSSQLDYPELWYYVHARLCSILNRSHTVQEIQEKILNLSYNSLPNCLKTCLLYFNMYPENYVIQKVHLVKQWIAEGFINATEGKDTEETAERYFDELVSRGMIQPMEIYYNDEVLSCTVHHIIHDLISHNSKEEEFIASVDYSQNITGLSTKALRLSFRFSSAKYAKKPAGVTMPQLRSIGFFGFHKYMPPIVEFKHLRVLIFDFWGTHDGEISFNLSRICMLFQLRYLKISSDIIVELPAQMQGLHYLETLEIDARVSAVPLDIVYLPNLLHLGFRDAIKLPDGIGRIKSLSVLWYFDLSCNSENNIWSLGELTNLRHLHLNCSAAMSSDHLKMKLIPLVSSLGKLGNLKSLTVTPNALRTAIFFDISSGISSPSIFLQRLELLPPICLFSRLPTWIGELHKLRILKIVVKELLGNDIDNIIGLPSLIVFSLYVRIALTGTVIFRNMAFPALKYFKFTCGVMHLAFQAGAMPNLQRLELCFNAHKGEKHSRLLRGIEHLLNLQEVAGRIGEYAGGDGSNSRAVKLWFEDTIRKHPKCPRFSLQFVDFIEEENPPLDKLHWRQQEGSSGEHGIIEDFPEDPDKQVDSRLSGLSDLPTAAGTSCHLKSGPGSVAPSTLELPQFEDIRSDFGSEQDIDQGKGTETVEASPIMQVSGIDDFHTPLFFEKLSRRSGQESKALLTRGMNNLIHHQQKKKTEIILRSPIEFDKRYVIKAAASIRGVESVTMEGDDKNPRLVVIGQAGLVDLVQELRKKLGEAAIAEVRPQVTLEVPGFPLSPPMAAVPAEQVVATPSYAPSLRASPYFGAAVRGLRPPVRHDTLRHPAETSTWSEIFSWLLHRSMRSIDSTFGLSEEERSPTRSESEPSSAVQRSLLHSPALRHDDDTSFQYPADYLTPRWSSWAQRRNEHGLSPRVTDHGKMVHSSQAPEQQPVLMQVGYSRSLQARSVDHLQEQDGSGDRAKQRQNTDWCAIL